MLRFYRQKKYGPSSVINCDFNGVRAGCCHIVAGFASEKMDGMAVNLKGCGFKDCQTDRADKELILWKCSYETQTDKIKTKAWMNLPLSIGRRIDTSGHYQTLVSVTDEAGRTQQVRADNARTDYQAVYEKKETNASGTLIGSSLISGAVKAGVGLKMLETAY